MANRRCRVSAFSITLHAFRDFQSNGIIPAPLPTVPRRKAPDIILDDIDIRTQQDVDLYNRQLAGNSLAGNGICRIGCCFSRTGLKNRMALAQSNPATNQERGFICTIKLPQEENLSIESIRSEQDE
jgi:hypothetical protein